MSAKRSSAEDLWERHGELWRDPIEVVTGAEPSAVDPVLLRHRVSGGFWEAVERAKTTLLVSREYEHLLLSLTVRDGRPRIGFLPLPHPSGIAHDPGRGAVHVASTRNPNRVFDLVPARRALSRADAATPELTGRPLIPVATRFYPGALYIHDLAMVGGELHANAVGENAVVRLPAEGGYERSWWPKAIEHRGRPDFSRNHIQLNSIAAGADLVSSLFTASAATIGQSKPGQRNFPVDGRGVVISGATREPWAGGLTRPHSARLAGRALWALDSGYGGLCRVREGSVQTVLRLPGWTRGLGIKNGIAFVGTSRVIPRFDVYAPGLEVERSVCGLHAVETRSGELLGSLVWPSGNQIFAVEPIPRSFSVGFPLPAGARAAARERIRRLFYSYAPPALRRSEPK